MAGGVEEWVSCLWELVWEGEWMSELKSERGASFLCCDFLEGQFVWCADELDFGFFR
jgi:hypothetical protein